MFAMRSPVRVALSLALLWPFAASAAPSWLDQQYADSASRTSAAVAAFATKLGLDPAWTSYCETNLRIQTGSPLIGSVYPFNVQLTDSGPTRQATDVLKVREDFERGYLMLCLANVKKSLGE